MKKYVVTAVDYSDINDGHPRCLGIFKTRDEAENYVRADIEEYADNHASENTAVDFMCFEFINMDTHDFICTWSIDEVEEN